MKRMDDILDEEVLHINAENTDVLLEIANKEITGRRLCLDVLVNGYVVLQISNCSSILKTATPSVKTETIPQETPVDTQPKT